MATARKTPTTKNAKPPAAATAPQSSQTQAAQSSASESSHHLAERDYIVQDSLHLDGKAYQAGDPITLTDDQVTGLPVGIVLVIEE